MSEMFEDIEGVEVVEVVVDDLLIWGETETEHDERLRKVLERTRQRNLKLNKEKSQIKLSEIHYIGHILNKEGLKPDPEKVKAICMMKSPENKEELQRFLGMVTYLGKFIPSLSQTAAPLRTLLRRMALDRTPRSKLHCHQKISHRSAHPQIFRPSQTSQDIG